MKKLLLLIGLCMIVLSSFVTGKVDQSQPDTPVGTATDFSLYMNPGGSNRRRNYVTIDIADGASGYDSAMINLYVAVALSSRNWSIYYFTDSTSWYYTTITWNNQPCGTTINNLTGVCEKSPTYYVNSQSVTGATTSINITKALDEGAKLGLNNISVIFVAADETGAATDGAWYSKYGTNPPTLTATWQTNSVPNTPAPSLVSVDESNNTNSDLNCSATITDPDGDSVNVTVQWFNNSVLMASYSLNNNYANGTTVSNIFSSNNFTADNVGDNIICSMQATDGSATSDWGNSTNLTLLEAYNTEPSNVKSYISYNINGELQYDENNASNPVAANSWALNFTADIYSNYSDSLNLVVCDNIASNESDCNVLCSSPSVTNGTVGCLYTPGTTGGFSRTAYAYTNGSWSNYTTIPYYVSSKGGDIPTEYNSSLPFFINTSVSDTITNPYTASCTSGSTCYYNYTVQITEEAGIGNYTLFAYDSKGLASFNNETFEVLGGVGYGSWTWTNVSVDENIVDRNETFVVTVTAYCQGPYACDYRSGAIHLDP